MSHLRVQARLAARGVDVDLTVDEGRVLAVLGPNGVGKSTLLWLLAGLLRPDFGRVCLGDVVLTDAGAGTFVPPHRRGVALLSQQPLLFPHLTVAANVAYGPRCAGLSRSAARAAARRPASSPSRQRIGSGAMRHMVSIWASVMAVPSGATASAMPARASAITSM